MRGRSRCKVSPAGAFLRFRVYESLELTLLLELLGIENGQACVLSLPACSLVDQIEGLADQFIMLLEDVIKAGSLVCSLRCLPAP